MASLATNVLTELLTVLRADLGTYDLSTVAGTHRVMIADGGRQNVTAPVLLLTAPTWRSTYDADLGEYQVEGRLEWWGFVAAATDDVSARAFAGLDFASEVATAVENAHFDNTKPNIFGLVGLLVSVLDVFAEGPEVPAGESCIHGEIVYRAVVTRGG